MKFRILIVILIFLLFGSGYINAQGNNISPEQIKKIIDSLDNPDWHVSQKSVYDIYTFKIKEAQNILETRFWDFYPRTIVIKSLEEFGSNKAYEYASAYYDTAAKQILNIDTTNLSSDDIYMEKATWLNEQIACIKIFFSHKDYSKAGKVMEILDYEGDEFDDVSLINTIMKNVPQYEMKCKEKLKNILFSQNSTHADRMNCFYPLYERYKDETFPLAMRLVNEYSIDDERPSILWILTIFKNHDILSYMKERLKTETDTILREEILDILTKEYGGPVIHKYLQDYALTLGNSEIKEIILNHLLCNPPIFGYSDNMPVSSMLDSLDSFNRQCTNYNWIDNQLQTELNTIIQQAKTYLNSKDSLNCAKKLVDLMEKVEFEYRDSLNTTSRYVTREGWQFLHEFSWTIIQNLPRIPTVFINLKNSKDNSLDGGKLEYYNNGWRNATNYGDGEFAIMTDQKKLTLRMTYAYGTQTVTDIIPGKDPYVFHTVNTQVKLQDSNGNPIDTGFVKYYSNGWYNFGKTTNGVAEKELLPVSYTFRMTYASGSIDKVQKIDSSRIVLYQTANTQVKLMNSNGNPIDTGFVKYYSNGWWDLGKTINGIASKELLPVSYTFRMTYASGSIDKVQKIDSSRIVLYQTANTQVKLLNSNGNPIDTGFVKYYSNGWWDFGKTTNGVAEKELLPVSYTFRMTYASGSIDKVQKIDSSRIVLYQTANTQVKLMNSNGNPIDTGFVKYYSNGWWDFGKTINGVAEKELLPVSYTFRMTYGNINSEKNIDVSKNSAINYSTISCKAVVKDQLNQPVNNAVITYYANGWLPFGTTANGEASREMLAGNIPFRAKYGAVQADKTQNTLSNSVIEFLLNINR